MTDVQKMADTVLQEAVEYAVTVKRPNLWQKLSKARRVRILRIQPITLGALLKIARVMMDFLFVDSEAFTQQSGTVDFLEIGMKNIAQNGDKLVRVIAHAVTNTEDDPPKELTRFLSNNLTPVEGRELLSLIVDKMNVMDFLACTVLATRTMIVKTGTTGQQTSGDSSAA